jgi:hypothetical protein
VRLRSSLVLAGCLALLAGSSARAERVDLTSYLAPRPQAGDYLVYATLLSDGYTFEQRYDVVSVTDVPGGWRVEWDRSGSRSVELVRPGERIRREKRSDWPPPGCRYAIDYDLGSCRLRVSIGHTRSFRQAYLTSDVFLPPFFSWARRIARYWVDGLEPIETPYASHDSAASLTSYTREWHARVRLGDRFEIESRGPLRLAYAETSRSWYVEGVGLVALRVTDGRPSQSPTTPPKSETWLREGLVQGQPYP